MYSNALRWLLVVILVILLDLVSKQWVTHQLLVGQIKEFIPWFNLFYARNYGAAFNFLADQGGWQRWFLVGIAIVSVAILILIMHCTSNQNKSNNISYAFIIGGALGNMLDRLCNGFVVDFIDFYISNWHYPTFNFADIFIFIGTTMIVLENRLSPVKKGKKNKNEKVIS